MFSIFCSEMLTFLFAMVDYNINEYQENKKIIIPFDKKTIQNIYFFLNKSWFNALNDRYIYTNNQTIVCLLAIIK